jgi:hypothetical protein
MKRTILLTLQLLSLVVYVQAQSADAAAELKKIQAYYGSPQLKHVKGQMLLKKKGTATPLDKVDFEYWVKGKEVYSKMNYIEILSNREVYVMVNHKKKTIYSRLQTALPQQPGAEMFGPAQLKQLLDTKGTIVSVTRGAAQHTLTMTGLRDTRFSSVVISYDAADYRITAVDAVVNETPGSNERTVLEIRYSPGKAVANDAGIFSASRYLVQDNNGKFIYTSSYLSYQKI